MRPRRSVLYMPAANERALEKAKSLAADAIIFDLEDAVAPDAKEAARANAVTAPQVPGLILDGLPTASSMLESPYLYWVSRGELGPWAPALIGGDAC